MSELLESRSGALIDYNDFEPALCSSSPNVRIAQLHKIDELLKNQSQDQPLLHGFLELLFKTHALYSDRESRRVVQRCLLSISKRATSRDVLGPFVRAMRNEARKPGVANSSAFVLVEWCSILMQHSASSDSWQIFDDILDALSQALDKCVRPGSKVGLARSATTSSRRGFRQLFMHAHSPDTILNEAVKFLTDQKGHGSAYTAPVLGIIAGLCARQNHLRPLLTKHKQDYYEFYGREIVGSRVAVPRHVSFAFNEFFHNFATVNDLEQHVIPAIVKSLLRAPEIVLGGVLESLIDSLPDDLDLSTNVERNLLPPLLSNVKSSNATTRMGAFESFQSVVRRCHNQAMLDRAAGSILDALPIGRASSAEQKMLYAKMLRLVPLSAEAAQRLCDTLSTLALKEGNEMVLASETSALAHACIAILQSREKLEHAVKSSYGQGLSEKKPSLRRNWLISAGTVLRAIVDNDASPGKAAAAELMFPKLIANAEEVQKNAALAAQNGLIIGLFILVALAPLLSRKFTDGPGQTLAAHATTASGLAVSPNVLLNERFYSKMSFEEDLEWFCYALNSAAQFLVPQTDENISNAWSEAVIFLITGHDVPLAVRRGMSDYLSKLYVKRPGFISELIIQGLWNCITKQETRTKAVRNLKGYSRVLKCICLSPVDLLYSGLELDSQLKESQACKFLVLARPELIPRSSWIETLLRMALDPGELVRTHLHILLKEIDFRSRIDQQTDLVVRASYAAAAELAFIAPDIVAPKLMDMVACDLDDLAVQKVGPFEAAVFRTPEGACFHNVVEKQRLDDVPDKNSKEYDILKWENEVRKQVEKKKGQQRQLSHEEILRFNAQLKKETLIRDSVRQLHNCLLRGIGIIEALATGPPVDAVLWLQRATTSLLKVIDAGASLIIGDVGATTYINCSRMVTSKIGIMRPFIGAATLKLRDPSFSPLFCQEKVEDLVTRVLYRLRFTGEQRPLDAVSFIYTLPLVLEVLRKGGVGVSDDDRDAQLVLAVEYLSYHAFLCQEGTVPRSELLIVLIQALQNYAKHYRPVKDCFADVCNNIAPTISHAEMRALVAGTIVSQVNVRSVVLQSISADVDLTGLDRFDEIWLACHDEIHENAQLAKEIWEESGFRLDPGLPLRMMPFLESDNLQLRGTAARSLAEATRLLNVSLEDIISHLELAYLELESPKGPELDKTGMPKKGSTLDSWQARHGIAIAFKELVSEMNDNQICRLFNFFIESGPLTDRNNVVRSEMLDAGIRATAFQSKQIVERLMDTFEQALQRKNPDHGAADRVNEAVVILYGALARNLSSTDAKIPMVIERLLVTLSTPSESVQLAISECLPPLMKSCMDKSTAYFERLLDALINSKNYAAQRGAAYGLAGMILGKGILSVRDHRILLALKSAIDDKESHRRESALLAFEIFSVVLGRLFEPYVIQIVPQLLSGFGDSNADVRDACLAASKACFGQLSSYGVKQILPTLLAGLEDQQWRSKRGACDLLSAMAYLDPDQLANSLPDIIPSLTSVLNDSHKEVRAAANRSLKRFGEVITNPEIKNLVPVLLKALSDPTSHTDEALDSLIKVHFIHYLDAPSLALIIRVLQRGLGDRSNTKRKAAQVVGTLAHLTEKKDIMVHLPMLVTGLKSAAVDPVPTTRATASKTLGSLVEKLGEDALPDLIPSLMQTLKADIGAGDRLGSAQALSEVLAGLGTIRLEETLPTILQNVESATAAVREGFMSLFIFLPVCFGNSFSNYLGRIVPPILAGLADDVESIRETALRAGRLLVKNFAIRAIDLLLPEIERGLADESHRIRLSSVELVGDLLFNLTGVRADVDAEGAEGDVFIGSEATVSLKEILGEERRNKILSALYICRCDTAGSVRSAAVGVWKVLVPSPRTLKELVPTLTQLLVKRLGTSNMEHKVIASNALGELIRKAGDGVLSSLLPTLQDGLQTTTDSYAKQGICLALRELISSASEEALEDHEKTLISIVRIALTDSDDEVREAAAEAFDSLQHILGKKAVDQVLPYLLHLLRSEAEADNALSALLTLLTETTRSNIILPNLIPSLTSPPISAFDARALASLSKVAGTAMNRRLPNIMHSLMESEIDCQEGGLRIELQKAFDVVVQSADEFDGMNTTMNVLLELMRHEDHQRRASAATHLGSFFASTSLDYSRYHQDIIRCLLNSFDDSDLEVVRASWAALNEFTKKLRKEEMESLVASTRQALLRVGVAGSSLRGFELPKGIIAILPIFLQGLMNGTADQRVQAALGISEMIDRTSEASLKPFISQIAGPLIRVISERAAEVKEAILQTLNNILEKMPIALKPFLPQLQRTFAKSLADGSSEVLRTRAAKALGTLIKYTPRIDPLIAELVTGSKTSDPGVKTAMLKALYEVVSKAGSNMSETSRNAVLSIIDAENDQGDSMAITNSKLLGALIRNVPTDAATSLLKQRVVTNHISYPSALAVNAVLVESPDILIQSVLADELPNLLFQGMGSKHANICNNFILATGKFLLTSPPKNFEDSKKLFEMLASTIEPEHPADSRRLALVVTRTLSRTNNATVRPHLRLLAPAVFSGVRDSVIPVKLAAEAAFVELFNVANEESRLFDKFLQGAGADLAPNLKKSMADYFKRVVLRLGAQIQERREAEGGHGGLGLSNDEMDDEKEIWSVGNVEITGESFA